MNRNNKGRFSKSLFQPVENLNRVDKSQTDITPPISFAHASGVFVDHDYCEKADNQVPNLDYVTEENFVFNPNWSSGRRIVELDVLAEGLKNCKKCMQRLFLHECLNITTVGLAAYLYIRCVQCQHINTVPTAKKHGKKFDVNTKLGTATLHSGLGERQINSVLGCLNIPTVSHSMLDSRIRECGTAIEDIARETTELSLKEELKLQGNTEIDVSVDAGWQKRGCGKAYDSLSGHCSMFGVKTGKVIDFAVRSKQCRVCGKSKHPRQHDCRRNWTGSAKAMEPDMVEEMVMNVQKKGATVRSITGDDDTSTIARLRANINRNIIKISDKNHTRKTISNALYSLQKMHPCLSTRLIKVILRNFSYMLAQNKGNPQGINDGLTAQSRHPFGDHSCCHDSWCNIKNGKNKKHKSLPWGKPLSDEKLRIALEKLFDSYRKHCEKLSKLGSTQSNESLNMTIASKASKARHYAASESLNFRVSASVAQKNRGHKYILDVNKKLGISPGDYTSKLCLLRDMQARKKRAIAVTVKAKRRRMQLKQERTQKKAVDEIREGPMYQPNLEIAVGLERQEFIPEATEKPRPVTLEELPENQIYFDLETTGLGRTSHIVQIAARRNDETFSTYVLPKKKMTKKAAEITKIDVVGNQMFYKNCAVEAVSIQKAIEQFICFLSKSDNNVLIGHNIQSFDCQVLLNVLSLIDKVSDFEKHCVGFVDTRKLFKHRKPCSQEALANFYLGETYNAHNAVDDVISLQRIVEKSSSSDDEKLKASFKFSYCVLMHKYCLNVSKNLPSLQILVDTKTVSAEMAQRIAGSGLCMRYLQLAYQRNNISGIESLFSEKCSKNTVRVSKSQKVINAVAEFLK